MFILFSRFNARFSSVNSVTEAIELVSHFHDMPVMRQTI